MQQATTNLLPSTTAISDDEMEQKTQWIKELIVKFKQEVIYNFIVLKNKNIYSDFIWFCCESHLCRSENCKAGSLLIQTYHDYLSKVFFVIYVHLQWK